MDVVLSDHLKDRIRRRNITEDEVENTIKYPEKIRKIGDKHFASKNIGRGTIEVLYEKQNYIKVITVYWL